MFAFDMNDFANIEFLEKQRNVLNTLVRNILAHHMTKRTVVGVNDDVASQEKKSHPIDAFEDG